MSEAKEILVGLEDNIVAPPMKMHYLLILDRSGSMESVRDITIKGFNENLQTIKSVSEKNNQNAIITFILFNNEIGVIHSAIPANDITEINEDTYKPDGLTALNDAIGRGIEEVMKQYEEGEQVFVSIFTDGEENHSKKYSFGKIKELLKEKQNAGWSVAYVGCEIDIDKLSDAYDIDSSNVLSFGKSAQGFSGAYTQLDEAYTKMSSRRRVGDMSNVNYFSSTDKDQSIKKDDTKDSDDKNV